MKIQPIASPAAVQQAPTNQSSAREKAINAFVNAGNTQPETQVVQNQNAISAEELGAIQTPESNEEARQEVANEDTQVEAPKAVEPEDTPESRRFAQLAKREKQLRLQAQQIKQQEEQFKARQAEMEAKWAQAQQPTPIDATKYIDRERFKYDPIGALAEVGVSYEELTNQLINPVQKDPRVEATISRLEAKIQELENKNQEAAKQAAERETQQYQAALRQIETDVKALVANDPNFETIKETRSTKDVVELIEQTYQKDGVLLSVEEAAQLVEDYLVEEATKLTKIGKIQAKLAQSNASKVQATAQKTPAAQQQPKQPQPMKTLTNNNASSRQLSAKERAILAFKGELK